MSRRIILYHVDESAKPYDAERCAAWSPIYAILVMGPELDEVLDTARGILLASIGGQPKPPKEVLISEEQCFKMSDRPRGDSR